MSIFKAFGFAYTCKNPKTIYLGRLGGVGDILLISPTVIALREKFPKAEITFGCSKGIFHDMIANDPNIDKFDFPDHEFVKAPSKNVIKYIAGKILYLKNHFLYNLKYDLVVFFYDHNGKIDHEKHMVDRFAEMAGVHIKQRRPIVYLNEEDMSQAKILLQKAGVKENEKYLVLAHETGYKGRVPDKDDHRLWNNFPELIEKIHQKYKIKILTLLPKSSEDGPPGTIRIKDEPTIRAGAAIIKQCALFIGLDCGQMHIASAFDIKIVSIHIGYPIEQYGSLSPHTKFVSNAPFLFSQNNKEWEKKTISVDRVVKEVERAFGDI
jgi:ADP-heptose:LPS heptosyltransferase